MESAGYSHEEEPAPDSILELCFGLGILCMGFRLPRPALGFAYRADYLTDISLRPEVGRLREHFSVLESPFDHG